MSVTERWDRLPALAGDLLLLLALCVPVGCSLVVGTVAGDRGYLALACLLALATALLLRHSLLAALCTALAADALWPGDKAMIVPALVVLFAIALRRPWTDAVVAGAAAAVVESVAAIGWGLQNRDHGVVGIIIAISAQCAAAIALGLYAGARRKVAEGLRERAERLTRERELLTERAVAEERLRIARELHDVIGHNVSLMVVQAQALAATVGGADERVLGPTSAIADLGRQAMAEMHRTLRLLRASQDEQAQLAPQPGLAELDDLLVRARSAGLQVELVVEGEPRPLSQSVDLSAFRIVQEALTNVIKHAAGAHASVMLSYRRRELGLAIVDNGGDPSTDPHRDHAAGHGVTGMRERVTLFGGALTAQSRETSSGFQVTATLPYAEPSP